MDYKNGKIYALRSYKTDDVYIGSTTTTLTKRKSGHKGDYKEYLKGKKAYITSFELIKHDDCYIELIEDCPSDNRNQLERREGQIIRETDCVNRITPGRTKKEYYQNNKIEFIEKSKIRYENNKDQIKKQHKIRYENNKEKILERSKKYNEANREEVLNYLKKYREKNKEQLYKKKKERIVCECGAVINRAARARHMRSNKHKDWHDLYEFIHS